ncbi:MAG: helix-turn-helix domain containing protein [Maricaulis sp.]|jgi:AcrR family transcriptional regulator|nr:helix-turn-helix domain containing protein [Maricaulis sp.]MDG2043439.1 helix-turn-helix domain containing protein [Maricaulis sp.]
MTKTSKEALSEIALDLFARKGFRETSIGDIEDAAGLKRRAGGFYRHFKSKDAVLFEGLEAMAAEMVAEVRLEDVLQRPDVRAELIFIATSLLDHAAQFRVLRLLLLREAHKVPELEDVMQSANLKLARQDIVPWTEHALKRAGKDEDATSFSLLVFGPVLTYLISLDRDRPAFGLDQDVMLESWASYWAGQLQPVSEI